nr:MAG TPA: hypothetical protein [Caudoviricetes sp.]
MFDIVFCRSILSPFPAYGRMFLERRCDYD